MKKKVLFFTAEYPFGNKSETFVENEIEYLSSRFDEVIVVPSFQSDIKIRKLPYNVFVNKIFIENRYCRKKIVRKHFVLIASVFFSELFKRGNFLNYLKNWKYYVDFLCLQYHRYLLLRSSLKQMRIDENTLFYDFWYVNSSIALCFLKSDGLKNRIVLRAHRYDVYDEESERGRVPFRTFISKNVSIIAFCSNHGKQYFIKKNPDVDVKKLIVSYLGVPDKYIGNESESLNKGEFTIVSCSGITKRKRVDFIPLALCQLKQNIKWIHFGDGVLMDEVKSRVKNLPPNITCNFMGHVDNAEVISFYQNNKVDLFISFTTSEGSPVSFKEAISFGIPIFSTDVCGIPDIVNVTTGIKVGVDDQISVIAGKLSEIIETYPFNRKEIRKFFLNNFLADKVYTDFIDSILLESNG
jgi:colanic acid/amylovoran biosynthesis glycosyltransferase